MTDMMATVETGDERGRQAVRPNGPGRCDCATNWIKYGRRCSQSTPLQARRANYAVTSSETPSHRDNLIV